MTWFTRRFSCLIGKHVWSTIESIKSEQYNMYWQECSLEYCSSKRTVVITLLTNGVKIVNRW